MMTVHEVSRLTGVSIRTLQYYDRIGLLHPADYTGSGYRLYDDTALETLQHILLFRELEFSLKDIREIVRSPAFDRNKALDQQIALLRLKKEHLENLIALACGIKEMGVKPFMDFSAFDTKKMDEYAAQAKASWGTTPEYQEYERKTAGRSKEKSRILGEQMMQIFCEFGAVRNGNPASDQAQALVKKLQDFITENYYTCPDEMLSRLGMIYAGGGAMTDNIDAHGGSGTAVFVNEAIKVFCAG